MLQYNTTSKFVLLQFVRSTGKGSEETDLWVAYCAFHSGDYQKARTVFVLSLLQGCIHKQQCKHIT